MRNRIRRRGRGPKQEPPGVYSKYMLQSRLVHEPVKQVSGITSSQILGLKQPLENMGLQVPEPRSEGALARRAIQMLHLTSIRELSREFGGIMFHLELVCGTRILLEDVPNSMSRPEFWLKLERLLNTHPITQILTNKLRNVACPETNQTYEAARGHVQRLAE